MCVKDFFDASYIFSLSSLLCTALDSDFFVCPPLFSKFVLSFLSLPQSCRWLWRRSRPCRLSVAP